MPNLASNGEGNEGANQKGISAAIGGARANQNGSSSEDVITGDGTVTSTNDKSRTANGVPSSASSETPANQGAGLRLVSVAAYVGQRESGYHSVSTDGEDLLDTSSQSVRAGGDLSELAIDTSLACEQSQLATDTTQLDQTNHGILPRFDPATWTPPPEPEPEAITSSGTHMEVDSSTSPQNARLRETLLSDSRSFTGSHIAGSSQDSSNTALSAPASDHVVSVPPTSVSGASAGLGATSIAAGAPTPKPSLYTSTAKTTIFTSDAKAPGERNLSSRASPKARPNILSLTAKDYNFHAKSSWTICQKSGGDTASLSSMAPIKHSGA